MSKFRRSVNKLKSERSYAIQEVSRNRKAVRAAKTNLKCVEKAQKVSQKVAHAVQQKVHNKIADVVSHCLAQVFDNPYEFTILFEKKRGKTEAHLKFTRDGEEFDPTDVGGGPNDIAAFALRLSCILLKQPQIQKTVILDEPFKFIAPELHDRVAGMLDSLSKRFGFQFILITHDRGIECGRIERIS